MTPELKAELQRLRKTRFYYLSRKVPAGVWRDGDRCMHDMELMSLDHLQACIRRVTKDLGKLRGSTVSLAAAEKLGMEARLKRMELKAVFHDKCAASGIRGSTW